MLAVNYDAQTGVYSSPTELQVAGTQQEDFSPQEICCHACGNATATWAMGVVAPSPALAPIYIPAVLTTYPVFARPSLSCNENSNIFPIWNDLGPSGGEIKTTAGFCGTYLVPGSLEVFSKKNRFAFATECFCALRWRIYDCLQGIVAIRVYVNGALVQTLPGSVTHTLLNGLCVSGTEITIEPINILGFSVTSQTVILP